MFLEDGANQKKAVAKLHKKKTNLVLLFGDNLVTLQTSTPLEADRDKKLTYCKKNLVKFIIFPNPMYGSWEFAVYQGKN